MATVVDYFDRTYDVLALRNTQANGISLLDQSLFGGDVAPGGEICTGIVKLAQWFLVTFLTIKGSKQYDPLSGTTMVAKMLDGEIRTETNAFIAFGFAIGDIKLQAANLETADTPLDEQFDNAVLRHAVIAPGELTLYIVLTSKFGSSFRVILPIQTVP